MALIKCPECGKEISSEAQSCPYCGHPIAPKEQQIVVKEKKKGGCFSTILKVIGAIVVIFIIIIVIAMVAGNSDNSSDSAVKVGTVDDSDKKEDDNSVADNSVASDATEDVFTVGEVAEYKNIQVSVLGYDETNGTDYISPDEGDVFVFVNMEIANNTDDDLSISSMLSFTAYCDDYKLSYSGSALMALDGRNQLDGTIAPGKKLNGYLGLEVPQDWHTIEVQFTDNIWSSSKFKFQVTK